MICALAILLAALQPLPALADAVYEELVSRVEPPTRDPRMDRVAAEQALEIAKMPPRRRLSFEAPLVENLRDAGMSTVLRARSHYELMRGHEEPARTFVDGWEQNDADWEDLVEGGWHGLGLGVAEADDGWIVLVALLAAEQGVPRLGGDDGDSREVDVAALEEQLLNEVNHARHSRGLHALEPDVDLAAVARAHSEAMVREGFFSHDGPDGSTLRDRVERGGIDWKRIAENLQMSQGEEDPVASAVESWLASPGHRKNLLGADYVRSGVGVAIAEDGAIYFTQLYLEP